MPDEPLTISVLGLGTMGIGMAQSLLRRGFATVVWNRRPERAASLASFGATVVKDLDLAVDAAEPALAGTRFLARLWHDAVDRGLGAQDVTAVTRTLVPAWAPGGR